MRRHCSRLWVVLYTDSHPHTKKVVADTIIGQLSMKSQVSACIFNRRAKERWFSDLPPGTWAIWFPYGKSRGRTRNYLMPSLQLTEDCLLIVFCLGPDNQVLHHQLSAWEQLKKPIPLKGAIEAATTAINDILPENSKNVEGIYAALI